MHDHDFDPAHRPAVRHGGAEAVQREVATAGAALAGARDPASLLALQRTVGNAGVIQLLANGEAEAASPVHDIVGKGGGSPLDEGTRAEMEGRFGQPFDDVRVHTDASASASAESVGANAYTVGSDIVFRSGQFDATSQTGQRTLAHELSHVVQQRSGPVDGNDAPGGIRLSDPSDRFERAAEATASEVMSGAASAAVATNQPTAQREIADEDEEPATAQMALQREVADEEEQDDVPV